ncbi:MAG: 2-hydroxyacyl-CoA dehydratase family protein [Dehalococcoidia bacterium]|nr:2-hydroxyacyl-CoA dehydratase family protein [Dehalococcoidia bacterium]
MIYAEEKIDKLDSIVRACGVLLRMNKVRPDARESERIYYKMLSDYFTRLQNAKDEGNFIAAHTVFFPTEILDAMDIVPMHTETTTWMISLFTGECADLLSAGTELGLASEICTPHRGLAGAFASHALPRPDVMLWSNLICDNTAKSGELLMEINKCPGFFIDHPFQHSEEEKKYLVGELNSLIRFLEEQSGHKMDWDRLSEIVARMDKQIELFREICELRKAVPSPFHTQGFLELLTIDYLFPGQPEAIHYLETLRQELADRVKAGQGAVDNERFRLMSFFIPPMYLIGFMERISQEFGAVSVTEPFFTYWGEGRLDPGKPLESIAEKSYMLPEARMYGPLDDRAINSIIECAKEYKVDGAIYYADVGCRHTCAAIKLFKDILNEIDIPVLTLDCDVVDPTITSEEEMRDKLEQFYELLEDR